MDQGKQSPVKANFFQSFSKPNIREDEKSNQSNSNSPAYSYYIENSRGTGRRKRKDRTKCKETSD